VNVGLLDGILKQVAGSPDTAAALAEKVGIDPSLAEKAIAALGRSHAEPGDTVTLAAERSGLDSATLGQIMAQLGGEGALAEIASRMSGDSRFSGFISMLDRDGDGNPLNDVAGIAKGLFG